MKVHELKIETKPGRKRVGRGISAGQGKTAGRGTKGQNARSGGRVRIGFEGGQNPLAKRLPKKRGFHPLNRVVYQIVNLEKLEQFKAGAKVDVGALREAGLIKNIRQPVKILGQGKFTKKLNLFVHAASSAAAEQVAGAGGKIEIVKPTKAKPPAKAPKTKPKTK